MLLFYSLVEIKTLVSEKRLAAWHYLLCKPWSETPGNGVNQSNLLTWSTCVEWRRRQAALFDNGCGFLENSHTTFFSSLEYFIVFFSYKYRSGSLNILQDKKISRGGIVKIDCRLYFQGVAFTLIRFVSHSLAVSSSCHSSSCTNTKDGPSTNLKCIFSFKKTFVRRIYVYKWILFLWSINLIH